MRIKLASVFVDDQDKALRFYTDVLGFVKKMDIPVGEARFLTVVSPDGPDDLELLLEPNDNPAAAGYQKSILEQGIPATSFFSDNVREEHGRLVSKGVVFRMPPTETEWGVFTLFEDTCGNLIQLQQG